MEEKITPEMLVEELEELLGISPDLRAQIESEIAEPAKRKRFAEWQAAQAIDLDNFYEHRNDA